MLSKETLEICAQLVNGYQLQPAAPNFLQVAQVLDTARDELKAALSDLVSDPGD